MRLILSAALLVGLCACSDYKNRSPIPSISDDARAGLAANINCNTAPRDIQTLEDERASTGRQILSGVRSVLPIAAVAGLLMGDYSERVEVASGKYNRDITNKIAEIKTTCGIR